MVYKIRTGNSWRDLPERYGAWKTVYTRFSRYALDGVFTRALQQIQARADAADDIDRRSVPPPRHYLNRAPHSWRSEGIVVRTQGPGGSPGWIRERQSTVRGSPARPTLVWPYVVTSPVLVGCGGD